jgi:hypothetical protein
MNEEYTYKPQHQDPGIFESPEKFSTSLQELDNLDLIARNDADSNFVVNPDSASYPNILEKPLFIKTMPDKGILLPDKHVNKRTQMLSGDAEHANLVDKENEKYQNRTMKEFVEDIAGSYLGIINDLLSCRSPYDVVDVFTKDNRLVAMGILFVVISVFFVFFNKIEN